MSFRVSPRPFNPYQEYRGGGAYRSEDPTFTAGGRSGFSAAAGLSTLPSIVAAQDPPDYIGISQTFNAADAAADVAFTDAAGTLIANEAILDELPSSSGGRDDSSGNPMLSKGLGILANVAGTALTGNPLVGKVAEVGAQTLGGLIA